jgi:glutamate synthase domain-containing protein 2
VDSQPFGTDFDVYDNQYESMTHAIQALNIDDTDFRIRIGGPQCRKPYEASLLNISAMSFGALSGKAIEALNRGARAGGFYQDTGEGGISPYHRLHGGDLVWEIGTGYFGCRDASGHFDVGLFEQEARHDQVRMIEIKLSQGAKPGHGGVLPEAKVTDEIARARKVPAGVDCKSPPAHSAFSTPVGLLEFVALLRERTGPCWRIRTRRPMPSGGPRHRLTVFSRCSIPGRVSIVLPSPERERRGICAHCGGI